MTAQGEGRGWAKTILLGEHSVVYGQPALAAALDIGVRVRATLLQPTSTGSPPATLRAPAWDVVVSPGQENDLARVLTVLLEQGQPGTDSVDLLVEPEVPSRAGLGSSAALAVAVVRALADLSGETLDAEQIEKRAGLAEGIFHGRASGIDAAVACRGGMLRFTRGEEPVQLKHPPLPAVVAHVEPRAPTSKMVEGVARARESEPQRIEAIFAEIGDLVARAEAPAAASDFSTLGRLMNHNARLLDELGVSTPALDDACAAARRAGAVGAKLTGAGGGGCMIALAPGCEDAVAAALGPGSQWVHCSRLG